MNPELRRNLWLEMTPLRVVIMPVILGLIFLLAYLTDRDRSFEYPSLMNSARGLFFIIICIWGVKSAASSVPDEISDHTWDFQRMSPISAWSMTWGKFLGSTSYAWYGGVFCLLTFGFAATASYDFPSVFRIVLYMITVGLLSQSIAFAVSIDSAGRAASGRGLSLAASVVSLPIAFAAFSPAWSGAFFGKTNIPDVLWYGTFFDFYWFAEISLAVGLAWCLIGAYRTMRNELQYQSIPWVWLSFMLYQMFYLGGFVPKNIRIDLASRDLTLFISFLIGFIWTYLLIISEPIRPVKYRKLFHNWSQKKYKTFLTLVPRWFITVVLTSIVGVLLALDSPSIPIGVMRISVHGFIIAALLFAIRDILVFHYLNFQGFPVRRASTFAVVYLIMVYSILPLLAAAMGLSGAKIFFHPFNNAESFIAAIAPAVIEVVGASIILWLHWKKNFSRRD